MDKTRLPRHFSSVCTLLTVLIIGCLVRPARATENQPTAGSESVSVSPFVIDARIDVPIITMATALWIFPGLAAKELPQDPCYPCDVDDVNDLDAITIDLYSEGANIASHVGLIALPTAAITLSLAGALKQKDYPSLVEDLTIFIEAMLVTGMLQQIVRHAYDRPRPYMYQFDADDSKRKHNDEDTASFYSGHTALSFTAAVAMSYLFSKRHARATLAKSLVWSVSLAVAASVGVLRVVAGQHFISDVLAGAVIGASTGLLVPALHLRREKATTRIAVGPQHILLSVDF